LKHIIKLTLKEVVNKRIIHLGITLTLIYILVYGTGLYYTAKDMVFEGENFLWGQQIGYQFLTLGWYVSTLMVGSIAIVTGAGSISQEIENGTILGLASSPIRRRDIMLGKFFAYSIVTSLYSILIIAAIMALDVYFFNLMLDPQAAVAGLIIFALLPVTLLGLTILFSSVMSTMTAGISSFMFFLVTVIGGFIEQVGALMGNASMVNVGIIASLLLPTDAVYRLALAQATGTMGHKSILDLGPFGNASSPSTLMLIYTMVYIAALLIAAIYYFDRRDL